MNLNELKDLADGVAKEGKRALVIGAITPERYKTLNVALTKFFFALELGTPPAVIEGNIRLLGSLIDSDILLWTSSNLILRNWRPHRVEC